MPVARVRNAGVVNKPLKRDPMPMHENIARENSPENAKYVVALVLLLPNSGFPSYLCA
jgi:hypothetical protein